MKFLNQQDQKIRKSAERRRAFEKRQRAEAEAEQRRKEVRARAELQEERLREMRAAQPSQPTSPPLRDKHGRPTRAGIANYFRKVDIALANHAYFPDPPAFPCDNSDCKVKRDLRILEACPCNLKFVFAGRDAKTERLRFHPDKFSAVRAESLRADMQAKAQEVFVAVDALYCRK